jgi:hypothetical protein
MDRRAIAYARLGAVVAWTDALCARLDRDRCWDRDDAIVVRDDLRSRWCAMIFDRGNAIVVRDDLRSR